MRLLIFIKLISLAGVLVFISGCSTAQHTRFYLLTPDITSVTGKMPGGDQDQLLIAVGPVYLPEYLDRSQIVTRRSSTELDLADSHRWAEPLEDNFTRVLAENLYRFVGPGKVVVFPAKEYAPVNYRITVDVNQFDANAQGVVLLAAVWSVYDGNSKNLLDSQRMEYELDTGPAAGYPQIVSAMSRTIDLLSRDIFNALKGFDR